MSKPLKVIESQDEINSFPPFPFPNYCEDDIPDDWELVDTLFVDKTGVGKVGEPALTIEELKSRLKVGMAYAIIDEGQFQLHLGEYQPIS